MKKLNIAALMVATTLSSAALAQDGLSAGPKIDIKAAIGVATCTGDGATCPVSQSISAPGFTCCKAATREGDVKDLGEITADKQEATAMPQEAGKHTMISFTPSEGDLKGKKIEVGFELQPQRRGTPTADKNLVFIFRKKDLSKAEWGRAGILNFGTGTVDPTEGFTIKPNGDIVSDTDKSITISLGKAALA